MKNTTRIIAMLLFFSFNAFSQPVNIQWTGAFDNDMANSANWLTMDGTATINPAGNNLIINSTSTYSLDISNMTFDNFMIFMNLLFSGSFNDQFVLNASSVITGTTAILNQPELNSGITINDLTINSSNSLNIINNSSITVDGKLRNFGTLTFNSSTANINELANKSGGTMIFNSGAVVTVTEGMENLNSVTLNPGSKLTLETPTDVFTNSLDNSSLFTLESDATGSASFISKGSIVNAVSRSTGYFEIKRWFETNGNTTSNWHLVSSPTTNEEAETFKGHFLNYYDEEFGNFNAISSVIHKMKVGKGFVAKLDFTDMKGDGVADKSNPIVFRRYMPNTGLKSVNLRVGDGNDYFGLATNFNLIGNPYTSNLNWDIMWNDPSNNSVVDATLYYYVDNGSTEGDINGWQPYNANNQIGDGDGFISMGQAFGVLLTNNAIGATGVLTFKSDFQTHDGGNVFHKKSKSQNDYFELNTKSNNLIDKIYFKFNSNTSDAYDANHDAYKFRSFGETPTPYFVSSDNKKLSICEMPESESVKLGFDMDTNGEVELYLSNVQGFEKIILEDTKENVFTDITNSSYTFNHNEDESDEGRFIIHFKSETLSDTALESGFKIFSNRNIIYIESSNTLTNASINIYNTTGQLVSSNEYSSLNSTEIPTENLFGVYIIEITSNQKKHISKINLTH